MSDVSLFITMPTLGSISTRSVKSLMRLSQALTRRGIRFGFVTHEFSDIVVSRNQLMSDFNSQNQHSHMLMLDSDIVYRPETIFRLMEFGADFTAALYPQKFFYWNHIREAIEADAESENSEKQHIGDILSKNWLYNVQRRGFDKKPWEPEKNGDFITVPATGTGLMLVSKNVPQRLIEAGQAKHYSAHSRLPKHKGIEFYDFFSHLPNIDGTGFYGEDQSFCMRWVHYCHEKIWVDTKAAIGHEGSFHFEGRFGDNPMEFDIYKT